MSILQTAKDIICPQKPKETKEEPDMTVYQSRWGYHPYSYETHLKLKRLHKWAFESYYKHCALIRWCAKRERRPEEEPQVDPDFTTRGIAWRDRGVMSQYFKDVETGKHHLQHIDKTDRHPVTEELLSIHYQASAVVEDFRRSRMPAENPEEMYTPEMSEQEINDLYIEVFVEGAGG